MSFIQALGMAPAPVRDLQVKGYPNGWASYQSPYSNDVLKGLQRELNRFGSGLSVDGVVGASTVSAVKRIGEQFRYSSYGTIATNLLNIAAGGPQMVATKGEYARYFISLLADKFATGSSGPTPDQVASADRASGGSSSGGGGGYTPPVVVTPGTPITAAMPAAAPNKMLMAAGAVIVGAIIIKEMRKGKRGGGRATRRR